MATRGTDSQAEYLRKLGQLIAEAKFSPDADLSFWIGLETQVIQKANEPNAVMEQLPPLGNAVEMASAGAGPAVMPGGGGGSPMGAPGPGGPMPASIPGGAMRQSPDMMRRALGGMGVQGG